MSVPLNIRIRDMLAALPPGVEVSLKAEWCRVCDAIGVHALAMHPLPKSFEVHHLTEAARKTFLEAFERGEPMASPWRRWRA